MKAQLKVGDELFTREQVVEMLNKQKTFCDTSVLKNLSIQFQTPAIVITDEPEFENLKGVKEWKV